MYFKIVLKEILVDQGLNLVILRYLIIVFFLVLDFTKWVFDICGFNHILVEEKWNIGEKFGFFFFLIAKLG